MFTPLQAAGARPPCRSALVTRLLVAPSRLAAPSRPSRYVDFLISGPVVFGTDDGLQVGDRVGVGAQVQADLTCDNCKADQENYCPNMVSFTAARKMYFS